ncbi:diacylglycerol kinase [Bacteroidales bacterium 6E]|nr:diacylglycerol kinase [Bacteroidales bacterium 6E]
MSDTEPFSFQKRIKSFIYAFRGIMRLVKKEHNARIHLVILVLVIVAGLTFKLGTYEWMAVVFASGLVFISELFNTAIEKLADEVDPKWNERIGQVKDFAAGAVLVSALVAIFIGALVFIPRIMAMF